MIPWFLREAIGVALLILFAVIACTPVGCCELEAEAEMDAEDEFFR